MEKLKRITVCLDMAGCPNRCGHCWLGHGPNPALSEDDLRWTAEQFRPLAQDLEVFDWYREPDFHPRYKERWELRKELSTVCTPHFELLSYWRAARDGGYLDWLKSLGVPAAQLTLFGGGELTDRYVGRKGAYGEIVKTIEGLLAREIAPRIQVFANKETLPELPLVERLIRDMDLENRCAEFGKGFAAFVHSGSCDGANEAHYAQWVTPEDLERIPPYLAEKTLAHFGAASLEDVFGRPEGELCRELAEDGSVRDLRTDEPVFYVDGNFNVYPNDSTPSPPWCLGNLREGGEAVVGRYLDNGSTAQRASATVPARELVRACGDPDSRRLFDKGGYLELLLNRYIRKG